MHKTLALLLLALFVTCDPTLEPVTSYLLYINEVEYEVTPKPAGCAGVKIEEDIEPFLSVGFNEVYAKAKLGNSVSGESNTLLLNCNQGCQGLLCQ